MKNRILTITLNPAIDLTIEIPDYKTNSVNTVQYRRKDPGGKGINVATALSCAGLKIHVTGFLGQENNEIFKQHFIENSIVDNFVYLQGDTREGIKIVDPKNGLTTDINSPGLNISPIEIEIFIDFYTKIISNFDYVILSGSVPHNISPLIYSELAKIAKHNGLFVAVDTSKQALIESINCGYIDLIKPNLDELSEIYPEIKKSQNKLMASHNVCCTLLNSVGIVALSLGDKGSRFYSRAGVFEANSPVTNVKSTVGAGDAFLAGIIYALINNKSMDDLLKIATSFASSKLTMYGPGLSKTEPPEHFYDKIVVKKILRNKQ